MTAAKRQTKPLIATLDTVAQFEAEARRLAGRVSENQVRFLKVAKTKGKEMEPVGRLAGVRIPRHPATQSTLIRPGIPRTSGHLFHGHPAGQSERSDAGMALLV